MLHYISYIFNNILNLQSFVTSLVLKPRGMVARRQRMLPMRMRLLQLGWECWMMRR